MSQSNSLIAILVSSVALVIFAPAARSEVVAEWECTSFSGWSRDDGWGQFFVYTDSGNDSIFSWGWWNDQAIWQPVGATYEADTVYTLTVLARKGTTGLWGVGLEFADASSGWSTLAEQSSAFVLSTYGEGAPWEEVTFSFDTAVDPSVVGKDIGIAVRSLNDGGSGWIHVDLILLETDAVTTPTPIVIDPAATMQRFEHWGTSLCWWANGVGDWADTNKLAQLLDLLFDQNTGLGLTFVRYNIGGGENPALKLITRPGAEVPGYQPQPGVWDWDADPYQRLVLNEALARGVERVDAFSNSPPWWMTISGSVTGGIDGGNNLQPDMYDEFADYLAHVVRYFRDVQGIAFDMIMPMNEPGGTWWVFGSGKQEGCHFDWPGQNQLIKEMGRALAEQGITGRKVGAPEEVGISASIGSLNYYDNEARSYIGRYNTHTYGGGDRTGLRNMAQSAGVPLIVSEYGNGTTSNFESMFVTAQQIARDVNAMQLGTWTYWQVVEAADLGEVADRWGMIAARLDGPEVFTVHPKYYGFKQFTANIRPGTMMIHPGAALEDRVLIGLHPNGQLTVVAVNPNNAADDLALDLSAMPFAIAGARRIRTSSTQHYANLPWLATNADQLDDTLSAESITTYLMDTLPNPSERWLATTAIENWSSAGAEMTETAADTGVHVRSVDFGTAPDSPQMWHVAHQVMPGLSYPTASSDAWCMHPSATVLDLSFDENVYDDGWLPDGACLYQDPPFVANEYVIVGTFQSEIGDTNDWDAQSAQTAMRDDGQGGDAVADDGVYTLRLTIPAAGDYQMIALADRSWNQRITTIGPIVDPHHSYQFTVSEPGQTVSFHCDINRNRIKAAPRLTQDWFGLMAALNGPNSLPAGARVQDQLDQFDLNDDGDVDLADVAGYVPIH